MKALKFLAAVAALALVACGPDTGKEDDKTQGDGFKVQVSTYTIAADGQDAAQFTATFNGVALQPEEITATVNGEAAELPGLKFTTSTPGSYSIQLGYKEHKSENYVIEAIEVGGLDLSPIEEILVSGVMQRALAHQADGTQLTIDFGWDPRTGYYIKEDSTTAQEDENSGKGEQGNKAENGSILFP
jgi:hypothetical protein